MRLRDKSVPSAAVCSNAYGTTVYAQRVPVKPAVLDKEQNSIAHFSAPGTA